MGENRPSSWPNRVAIAYDGGEVLIIVSNDEGREAALALTPEQATGFAAGLRKKAQEHREQHDGLH